MKSYEIELDFGQGGSATIEAESDRVALELAIAWAAEGDWSVAQQDTEETYGGCGDVRVEVTDEDGGTIVGYYTIPTLGDRQKEKLEKDGEVIATRDREWSTERITRCGGDFFLSHENGGSRGSWDRQCGDGRWRDYPVEPTRVIDLVEARCLLIDWGYDPTGVDLSPSRDTSKGQET